MRPPLGAASPVAVHDLELTRTWIAWPRGGPRAREAELREAFAGGDADLRLHEVDAEDFLGHRVLDLQARVGLDEGERGVVGVVRRVEQELEGARLSTPAVAARRMRRAGDALAQSRRQRRARRDLDQLLVAALDRAFALAEMRQPAAPSPTIWTSIWRARSISRST